MSIGLIAVGTVCAVAGATAGVLGTRRHLAQSYAQLAVEQAELDHAGDMQDLRYAELAAWSDDLGVEEDRLAQWDAFFRARFGTQPDAFDPDPEPEPEEPTVEAAPVNRRRFSYDPTAADRVHTVARPGPAEVLVGEQSVLFAERRDLEEFAAEVAPSAVYGGDHFESDALSAEIAEILNRVRWRTYEGGELTAALIAEREGMPTGQYPIVGTNPENPIPNDPGGAPRPKRLVEHDGTQDPERVAAAALMHAAATRTRPTEDEQPTPQPKPSPAVVGAA